MGKNKRREKEKVEKSYHHEQKSKVPSNKISAKNCLICFCLFNEDEKRPRTIPCGHTFCSECITSTIRDLIFTCPNCRKTYEAPSATSFPISYIVLELISETVTGNTEDNTEFSEDSMESLKPISRKLKSQIAEALTEVESQSCESSSLRSELQLYASQLDNWKSDHQQFILKLDDMVKRISKEEARVQAALREEIMAKTEMERTADSLKAENKTMNYKIYEKLENLNITSENVHEWIKATRESFPNMELVTSSQELRNQYQSEPVNSSLSEEEEQEHEDDARGSPSLHEDVTPVLPNDGLHEDVASSDEKYPTSSLTIQEKIQSALCRISRRFSAKAVQTQCNYESKAIQTNDDEYFNLHLEGEDEVVKMRLRDHLLLGRQFLALQEEEESGKKRFARLSLDEKQRVLLHALSEEAIHPGAYPTIIKYEEIFRHIPSISRRTFLEFGVDGRSLGRVVISLIDEGKLTDYFHILCLGREQGFSYRHSNILKVLAKGTDSECISLGDYERNDGAGGRAVVSGVDWRKEMERDINKRTYNIKAGFVWGFVDYSGQKTSQFFIDTRDHYSYFKYVFGKVEEGLDVIRNIVDGYSADGIKKVKVIDYGVFLST